MKTIANNYRFLSKKSLCLLALLAWQTALLAQSGYTVPQAQSALRFSNGTLVSGTAGADQAVYRFPSVLPGKDALVTITRRSNAQVQLLQMDKNDLGYGDALQPEIRYMGGSTSAPAEWWIEFSVRFVQQFTSTATPLSEFYVTALDMDGDNSRLQEKAVFYGSSSYRSATNSAITFAATSDSVAGSWQNGREVWGTTMDFPGVDTAASSIMASFRYLNHDNLVFRLGGRTTGASTQTQRMYSFYFKSFQYNSPSFLLPLMLYSFDAIFDRNNVDLNWITSWEKNLNHFEMERSVDGKQFIPVAYVAGAGYAADKTSYQFKQELAGSESGVLYYRLKLVTNDGDYGYSAVRVVRVTETVETTPKLTVYPNPALADLRVSVPGSWQGIPVEYEVYNMAGIRMRHQRSAAASQTEILDISHLNQGIYIVRISSAMGQLQQKLVKE